MEKLLQVQPDELRFGIVLGSVHIVKLTIKSVASTFVAFKLKTTNPQRYLVRPTSRVLDPGAEIVVDIAVQPTTEYPPDLDKCKDKFLLQALEVANKDQVSEDPAAMFSDPENASKIVVQKFKCVLYASDALGNPIQATLGSIPAQDASAAPRAAPDMAKSALAASLLGGMKTDEPVAAVAVAAATTTSELKSPKSPTKGQSDLLRKKTTTKVSTENYVQSVEELSSLKSLLSKKEEDLRRLKIKVEVERKRVNTGTSFRAEKGGFPVGSNRMFADVLDGVPILQVILMMVIALFSIKLFIVSAYD